MTYSFTQISNICAARDSIATAISTAGAKRKTKPR